MQSTRNDTKNRPAAFARSKIKVARIRNNIHDPLEEDKRTSDYHRLATAEAQPEADAFCI